MRYFLVLVQLKCSMCVSLDVSRDIFCYSGRNFQQTFILPRNKRHHPFSNRENDALLTSLKSSSQATQSSGLTFFSFNDLQFLSDTEPFALERECFEENCDNEELFEVYDDPSKHYEIKSIFDVCHRKDYDIAPCSFNNHPIIFFMWVNGY